MTVSKTQINKFVSDSLERANIATDRKKKAKSHNDVLTMEDFFKMLQAQSKYMGIDNEGSDFDLQGQLIQMQQHQLALQSFEMENRKSAYDYVGKDVVVKKRNGTSTEAITGKVDFVEFPEGAREPRFFVNGEAYSLKDIVGEGNVEEAVEKSENHDFSVNADVVQSSLQTSQAALEDIKKEVSAIEYAENKVEANVAMDIIRKRLKSIESCQASTREELKRLSEVVAKGIKRIRNFRAEDQEDAEQVHKKVNMAEAQPEETYKQKDKHLTKEELKEQVAAAQLALAEAKKVSTQLGQIKKEADLQKQQAGQKIETLH